MLTFAIDLRAMNMLFLRNLKLTFNLLKITIYIYIYKKKFYSHRSNVSMTEKVADLGVPINLFNIIVEIQIFL